MMEKELKADDKNADAEFSISILHAAIITAIIDFLALAITTLTGQNIASLKPYHCGICSIWICTFIWHYARKKYEKQSQIS